MRTAELDRSNMRREWRAEGGMSIDKGVFESWRVGASLPAHRMHDASKWHDRMRSISLESTAWQQSEVSRRDGRRVELCNTNVLWHMASSCLAQRAKILACSRSWLSEVEATTPSCFMLPSGNDRPGVFSSSCGGQRSVAILIIARGNHSLRIYLDRCTHLFDHDSRDPGARLLTMA